MKWKDICKKVLTGLTAGFINGFFASGGGMILVPAFTYLFGQDQKKARATSVFCILPMVIASGIFYYNQNFIDWKIGILCGIGGIIRRNNRGKITKEII